MTLGDFCAFFLGLIGNSGFLMRQIVFLLNTPDGATESLKRVSLPIKPEPEKESICIRAFYEEVKYNCHIN